MEHWLEIYKNEIPMGNYQSLVQNGEGLGFQIKLESNDNIVNISFGIVSAFRMLDEGVVLSGVFSKTEIDKYKKDNFSNIIYKIENGEFGNFIDNASSGLYNYLNFTHYLIITMNYIIEVISRWEPNIEVMNKNDIS